MASCLLHGILHVTIFEADGLFTRRRKDDREVPLVRRLLEATIGDTLRLSGTPNRLYATVDLGKTRVGRTRIIDDSTANPVWGEKFRLYTSHDITEVVITVKEDDAVGATLIGRARIPASDVLTGQEIYDWYILFKDDGSPVQSSDGVPSRVRVSMQFVNAKDDEDWSQGIPQGRDFPGVPYTFNPQRTGCRVTLYQDAHMPDNFLPYIPISSGVRDPTRTWEDVYNLINNARYLVYITGWSVYTEIKLVRDEERMIDGAEGVTLGQLLKQKADEGVRVNVMVWDDRTSGYWIHDGVMETHDEDTANYFRGTTVNCFLCPRNPDDALSIAQEMSIGLAFTHHQKTIIVDAPVDDSGQRRIVSFVGGIDLCDGRYDTQHHPLFGTLNGVHADDFHQPNFDTAAIESGGPREPWHDVHSKLEGPAAWDVLHNFEQRWKMQAGDDMQEKLLSLVDIPEMDPSTAVMEDDDPETWNVQVFRSIDGGAVVLPTSPDEAAKAGLVTGKNNVLDRSIQDAYINAIRRAKNFVYIENQYFVGSAFGWPKSSDCPAINLIPIELARKIVSKIEVNQRFAVYIVMPMWPEAVAESGSVQAILAWTIYTMKMMYKLIGDALHAKEGDNPSSHPRDYLNFYCLGNRETVRPWEVVPTKPPAEGTDYQLSQVARRFMIYVHAKMMIVDDEYVIVGSANINERSLNGARDTEIAMGAYQPNRLNQRAQVHGFRMSLWYEHLGTLGSEFVFPERLECVRAVNEIANDLWSQYMADQVCDMTGHLLPYPVAVDQDGIVTELPEIIYFPDTKGYVLGEESSYLPAMMTC
ncbi:hypothetical protein R1flu_018604 [Riccia fluitans]|uniref:Phospholipase D n=1 Tax=Riccia fluitans TaxID=41844 RepID=A0ABD1ZGB2_9MARC